MIRFPIQYACNSQATILEALGLALYLTIFASQEEREADQFGLGESEVILLNLKDPNMPKIVYFILCLMMYCMWNPRGLRAL